MTATEELNNTIKFYWNAIAFYAIIFVTLYIDPRLTAIITAIVTILVSFPLYKLYKLRRSPALYIAEIQRFCEQSGECKCQKVIKELEN